MYAHPSWTVDNTALRREFGRYSGRPQRTNTKGIHGRTKAGPWHGDTAAAFARYEYERGAACTQLLFHKTEGGKEGRKDVPKQWRLNRRTANSKKEQNTSKSKDNTVSTHDVAVGERVCRLPRGDEVRDVGHVRNQVEAYLIRDLFF